MTMPPNGRGDPRVCPTCRKQTYELPEAGLNPITRKAIQEGTVLLACLDVARLE